MLTERIVVIVCNICMYQIFMSYTLNRYSLIGQLYLNKTRGKEQGKKKDFQGLRERCGGTDFYMPYFFRDFPPPCILVAG